MNGSNGVPYIINRGGGTSAPTGGYSSPKKYFFPFAGHPHNMIRQPQCRPLSLDAFDERITLGREDLARTLAMPQSKIRLIGTVVGGNFGGKNEITNEPILALLSKKAGRPV